MEGMSCESKVERNDPGRIDEEAIAEVAMLSDGGRKTPMHAVDACLRFVRLDKSSSQPVLGCRTRYEYVCTTMRRRCEKVDSPTRCKSHSRDARARPLFIVGGY